MKYSVGTKVANRYHLQEPRGEGTYGEVWKAWDEQMARTVAIKALHKGKEAVEQLRKEGILGGGLSHKNIVQTFDFSPDGLLILEYVEGRSLEEMLVERRRNSAWVTHREAVEILKQCLEALEHAHEKQRVHGDVKPANILIKDRTNEVKLTDFGVARIVGAAGDSASPKGSTTYAAPEVLRGENGVPDFQSDLFSLGMIAYLLLTKRHPFVDMAALMNVPEMITSEEPCTPPRQVDPSISQKLEEVTTKLLSKERANRYRNTRQALDELLSDESENIACSQCAKKNPVGAKFCNECGDALFEVAQRGFGPAEDAYVRSYTQFQAGLVYDAIQTLESSLRDHPKFAKGWAQLGYLYNNVRRHDQAEKACSRAIEIDRGLVNAYQTRGFSRSNLGRFEDAVSDFNEAMRKTDDSRKKAQILYHRGHTHMLAGNITAACEDAKEALKLNPSNQSAQWLKSVVCT